MENKNVHGKKDVQWLKQLGFSSRHTGDDDGVCVFLFWSGGTNGRFDESSFCVMFFPPPLCLVCDDFVSLLCVPPKMLLVHDRIKVAAKNKKRIFGRWYEPSITIVWYISLLHTLVGWEEGQTKEND